MPREDPSVGVEQGQPERKFTHSFLLQVNLMFTMMFCVGEELFGASQDKVEEEQEERQPPSEHFYLGHCQTSESRLAVVTTKLTP